MKKNLTFCFLIAIVAQGYCQQQVTTFILLRHAEKASDGADPELSAEGVARAERLLTLLRDASITAIYSTKYKRTQSTVAPMAKEKNLTVENYDRLDAEGLNGLAKKHAGGIVLIAGHSNTIPQITNTLLGRAEYQNFQDNEFGIIFIVSVVEVGKSANVVKLKY